MGDCKIVHAANLKMSAALTYARNIVPHPLLLIATCQKRIMLTKQSGSVLPYSD